MAHRRWTFRPSLWPSVAAVVFLALTLAAGNWQMSRAEEKSRRQAQFDELASRAPVTVESASLESEADRYRRVVATGSYEAARQIYLDNRVHGGKAGFHVITPLRLESNGRYVLVNRGWVAKPGGGRAVAPEVVVPPGRVTVEGVAVVPSSKVFELSSEIVEGKVWQNLLLDRYRAATGLDVLPVIIEQHNDAGDGLVREWTRPGFGVEKHMGYALQWFSFAALIVVLYIGLNLKRVPAEEQ